jgi:hypothetical protein
MDFLKLLEVSPPPDSQGMGELSGKCKHEKSEYLTIFQPREQLDTTVETE